VQLPSMTLGNIHPPDWNSFQPARSVGRAVCRNFKLLRHTCASSMDLEREAEFQANGPPIINPFLAVAKVSPAKLRVRGNVLRQNDGAVLRVETNAEIAKVANAAVTHR